MKYLARINQLLVGLSSAARRNEDDRNWNAWLNLDKRRKPRDLQPLLASDVRKEFKARALIVLLAPDLQILPFRWTDEDSLRNYMFLPWLQVKDFPQDLVTFAGELVCLNVDYALGEKDEKVRGALFEYNKLILQFLAVLPEDGDLAQRLFDRYQINDPVPYWNFDNASGYNPLHNMLCAADVPIKWKALADSKIRERIVAELEGREQPRGDWETALQCYIGHIEDSNYDGRENYSRDLFASQIRFITELPGIEDYNQELFSSWQVVHIMEAIPGDHLHETRHKLARLIVLRKTEGPGFSIFNPESHRAAQMMLREFGAEDRQLSDKLNALIADAQQSDAENAQEVLKQRQKSDAVLNQMK